MAELIVLVLDDPDKTEEVLKAWVATGVPGVTLLNSTGLRYELGRGGLRDDVPLFPSLEDFLQSREEEHRTLFAIVPDGFDLEALVRVTERITGALEEPDTGILFSLPVARVWGLNRRQQ
jgi:hypothetical protein